MDKTSNQSQQPIDARPSLDQVTETVVDSYRSDHRIEHINATFLPSRDKAIQLFKMIRSLLYPGFFERRQLDQDNLRDYVCEMLAGIRLSMTEQIDAALRYAQNLKEQGTGDACPACTEKARQITDAFLKAIPQIRQQLSLDVQAAFEGDPAAHNTDEAIFCYPGILAITSHRIAHHLYMRDVPLLPRIISEYAHALSGIDINPGATIGKSFFIDHGTGVVIGETATIGDHVKLYQGVTIGAHASDLSQRGRGRKRHPTIEDKVIIYAGATILGGQTIIGKGSVIGGGVFLTKSVPPGCFVSMKAPELKYRSAEIIRDQL